MINWRARLVGWIILSSLAPSSVAGSLPSKPATVSLLRTREIHDEAEPRDGESCSRLGYVDVTFRTERDGPPAIGMVVTDPHGRRIGFDPLAKESWQDLPEAQGFIECDRDEAGRPNQCAGHIQICGSISGNYQLEVIATENTKYSVAIEATSQEQKTEHGLQSSDSSASVNAAAQKGSRDSFVLSYSRDPAFKVALTPELPNSVAGNE